MNIRNQRKVAPGPTDTLATQTSVPPERLQALFVQFALCGALVRRTTSSRPVCFCYRTMASWVTGADPGVWMVEPF